MSRYTDMVARKTREHGDKFSAASLNPAFIDAYNNGDRYRVLVRSFPSEKPIWGYIEATSGWVPCFLLIRRRGQHGSSETIRAESVILNSKWIK